MNKTTKEVAKMMDDKINTNSNSIQSERLTKEQVQIFEEFVNGFNKRISIFPCLLAYHENGHIALI